MFVRKVAKETSTTPGLGDGLGASSRFQARPPGSGCELESVVAAPGQHPTALNFSDLQRLKGQGLRRLRVKGKAGVSEERVDESGSALDGPEPGADDGLELVEGGGGVVAQGPAAMRKTGAEQWSAQRNR
jgi:hypothetical protein